MFAAIVECTRMAGKLKVAQEKWQKWEEEVEAGLELAQAGVTVLPHLWRYALEPTDSHPQEGDVVYWRSAKGEPWQVVAGSQSTFALHLFWHQMTR